MTAVSPSVLDRLAVPVETIRAEAAEVDREARFPRESMAALREAGLLGLGLPEGFGGPGGRAAEVARAITDVAAACGSTAMVYTMHVVAARTLLATTAESDGPTADALREIAAGEHLTTIAFSERGSRSHFWAQVSRAVPDGAGVVIDADKSWVTAAAEADSYVTAVGAAGSDDPLATELYLLDARSPGIEVEGRFDGLGMRGNGSSPVRLRGVRAPAERRLGDPAGGFTVMLEATLPWFVLGCGACCVGLAGAALELAAAHAGSARLEHEDQALADLPTVRARLGQAKVRHEQARAYLDETARRLDDGDPAVQLSILGLKAACAEMAIEVTDAAMRVCGGAAYSRHLPLERIFRDARAAAVMAPTTDILVDLLGKTLTGRPLF
jgi:alkylation response protein AidB-like acyl-CoA dehydrogenase